MIATNTRQTTRLFIIVLAAGFSARLGRDKAWVRIHGVSLLERTVATLRAGTRAPVVVVRGPRQRRVAGVRWVTNHDRAAGLSTSILRGLRAVGGASAVLIVSVDMPSLRSHEVAHLIARWRAAPHRIAARRIVGREGAPGRAETIAMRRGESGREDSATRPGMPMIVPRRYFPLAQSLSGDRGFASVLASVDGRDIRIVDMPSATMDVDTPEDLRRARRAAFSRTARRANRALNSAGRCGGGQPPPTRSGTASETPQPARTR